MKNQTTLDVMTKPLVHYAGIACMGAGGLLVATSSYKLGWRNVFMGERACVSRHMQPRAEQGLFIAPVFDVARLSP